MSQPDNVARIIAGASALFTATNMAVSFATYRRKRPRATLEARLQFVTVLSRQPGSTRVRLDGQWPQRPYYELKLSNHGESPLRTVDTTVEVSAGGWFRTLVYRLRPSYSHLHWKVDLIPRRRTNEQDDTPPPVTLDGFAAVQWEAEADAEWQPVEHFWCSVRRSAMRRSRVRAVVGLPGGREVRGKWERLSLGARRLECSGECVQREAYPYTQMSFDDVAGA
jgi:hypothetical protein